MTDLKRIAYREVRKAIKSGLLVPATECNRCGTKEYPCSDGRRRIQAHHHDHSKPLDVEWICPLCHRRETPMPRYRPIQPLVRGERNGSHVLKDHEVIEIRRSPLTHRELGKIYGVDHTTIGRIKRNQLRQWTI